MDVNFCADWYAYVKKYFNMDHWARPDKNYSRLKKNTLKLYVPVDL